MVWPSRQHKITESTDWRGWTAIFKCSRTTAHHLLFVGIVALHHGVIGVVMETLSHHQQQSTYSSTVCDLPSKDAGQGIFQAFLGRISLSKAFLPKKILDEFERFSISAWSTNLPALEHSVICALVTRANPTVHKRLNQSRDSCGEILGMTSGFPSNLMTRFFAYLGEYHHPKYFCHKKIGDETWRCSLCGRMTSAQSNNERSLPARCVVLGP